MEVYEFDKSLSRHLNDCSNVLRCTEQSVPASRVRTEWAYHIELKIEPAGWNALWKIPRILCEEYSIRYPTVVYGTVQQVLFKELKATFSVEFVEDDDVRLAETYEVDLEDLWPTKQQINDALDIEGTADCIDSLRFFYKNIWMPWDADNDDDLDWTDRHLESRIKFYYDMKIELKRPIVSHIRRLLTEARYLQSQKEQLEMELSDDEDLSYGSNKNHITKLMRIHLRISMIKNEIELLENPETRAAFEEMNNEDEDCSSNLSFKTKKIDYKDCTFIVSKFFNLNDQLNYLNNIRELIGGEKTIQLCTKLQDCLEMCKSSNEIYISVGKHFIKYLEHLNDNGSIHGVAPQTKVSLDERVQREINFNEESIIRSTDQDSLLLWFNGNFTIENVIIDCSNVRTGILIRKGTVKIINCTIIGDRQSSTSVGVMVLGNAIVTLENCVIKHFATAINCYANGKIIFNESLIYECSTGIETFENSSIEMKNGKIRKSKKCGISVTSKTFPNDDKKIIVEEVSDLNWIDTLSGNCEFEANSEGNIIVFNHSKKNLNEILAHAVETDDSFLNSTDDFIDCESSISTPFTDSLMIVTVDDSVLADSRLDGSVIEIDD